MADLLPAAGDLVVFKPVLWTRLSEVLSLPMEIVSGMVGVVEQDFEYRLQAGLTVVGDPDPAGGSAAVGVDRFLVHTALHDLTVTRRATDGSSDQVADMLPAPGDHVMFKPDMWNRVASTLRLSLECVPGVRGVCFALASDPKLASGVVAVELAGHQGKLGGSLMVKCELSLLTVTKRNRADNASEFVHSWQTASPAADDDAAQEDATDAAPPAELAGRPAETAHNADGGSAKLLGAFGHADVQVLNRWADVFRFGLNGDDRSPSPPLSDGEDNHWEAPKEALTEALPAPATLASEVPVPTTLNVGIA